MKLTAPPPGTAPEPIVESPPAESPAAPAPAAPPPYQKPPEKVVTWPSWFGPMDIVLAGLVLAVAFLAASFSARNSDLWVHLAAGQRLTTGDYKLGTDPFSYTGAERTWVNHSWLFDLAAFLLYTGDGLLLVVVKAIAVATAFGILFAIRRSGQPLWPWVVFTLLGVLASTNLFALRPYVGSMLFLALTLLLVFRLPSPPGSWRLPIAIGILFCLWSNMDVWFVLGPAALLLLFLGQSFAGTSAARSQDPLGALPDSSTLGKSLLVGVLACMVNPHHVGVWELPFELLGAGSAEADPRIRVYFYAPLRYMSVFWSSEGLAYNPGGLAYVILLISGLYVAFLSGAFGRFIDSAAVFDPLPVPHMLLWLGFAVLSLFTLFAVPFFAIVTVPLVAARWNLFSSQVQLGFWSDRRTRMLVLGSAIGRFASLIAVLWLGAAAWPGWLHAPASCWWDPGLAHPASTRRVEWKVEPDPDLQQAALWLNAARDSGELPADVRGFAASIDLANYCAWFAPREKVFANGRLAFHRPELPDLIKARRGLGLFSEKAEPPDLKEAEDVLKAWKASYVAVSASRSDRDRPLLVLIELEMYHNWNKWSVWYVSGRTVISGWRPTKDSGDPTFARLELNPHQLAYGSTERVPDVKGLPPAASQTMWDEFFTPRKPTPVGAEEAMAWLLYKSAKQRKINECVQETASLLRLNVPGIATPTFGAAMFHAVDEMEFSRDRLNSPPPMNGTFQTFPILAIRAARRAIAEDPDHPDGYYALAQALGDRDLPMTEAERAIGMATACQQCLARLPKPADFRRTQFLTSPAEVARTLAKLYLGRQIRNDFVGMRVDASNVGDLAGGGIVFQIPAGPTTGNQASIVRVPAVAVSQLPPGSIQLSTGPCILPLDLARNLFATAEEYAKYEISDPDERSRAVKVLAEERKFVDAIYQRALDGYRSRAERTPRVRDRHVLAMNHGLLGEALTLIKEADLPKEFGEDAPSIALHLVALELAVGRLEDASAHLQSLREELPKLAEQPRPGKAAVQFLRRQLDELEFQKLVFEGNYAEAGKAYEGLVGDSIGKYPPAKPENKPFEIFQNGWPAFPVLATTDTVFGFFPRYWGGHLQFLRYAFERDALVHQMQQESEFFFRRGFLSLLEGDIAGAKSRFQSAVRPPPPGWKVVTIRHRDADVFLKQIEAAEKREKK